MLYKLMPLLTFAYYICTYFLTSVDFEPQSSDEPCQWIYSPTVNVSGTQLNNNKIRTIKLPTSTESQILVQCLLPA